MVSSLDTAVASQPISYWSWLLYWDGGLMFFIIMLLWVILGCLSSVVFLIKWHKRYGSLDVADILMAFLMCISGFLSFMFVLCLFYEKQVKDILRKRVL